MDKIDHILLFFSGILVIHSNHGVHIDTPKYINILCFRIFTGRWGDPLYFILFSHPPRNGTHGTHIWIFILLKVKQHNAEEKELDGSKFKLFNKKKPLQRRLIYRFGAKKHGYSRGRTICWWIWEEWSKCFRIRVNDWFCAIWEEGSMKINGSCYCWVQ